jgi:photosystem I P700 chlorophyll a apoprotein A1
MAISSTDRRAKNVQIFVEKDAVETSFEKWAQPGHFSRTLAKGPKTTTWIWNYMQMLMTLIVKLVL